MNYANCASEQWLKRYYCFFDLPLHSGSAHINKDDTYAPNVLWQELNDFYSPVWKWCNSSWYEFKVPVVFEFQRFPHPQLNLWLIFQACPISSSLIAASVSPNIHYVVDIFETHLFRVDGMNLQARDIQRPDLQELLFRTYSNNIITAFMEKR